MKDSFSPAAQAVFDAACDSLDRRGYISDQVAAALRALAARLNDADAIRQDILDIAEELEGADA